jgi:hypothetical protein
MRTVWRRNGPTLSSRSPKWRPTSKPTLSPAIAAKTTTAASAQIDTVPRFASTPPTTAAVSPGTTKPTNSASSANTSKPTTT